MLAIDELFGFKSPEATHVQKYLVYSLYSVTRF